MILNESGLSAHPAHDSLSISAFFSLLFFFHLIFDAHSAILVLSALKLETIVVTRGFMRAENPPPELDHRISPVGSVSEGRE